MSRVPTSKHDVHLWWSTVGEVEGTSGAARGPSVAFRRAKAWAACSSVVSAYGPRGRVVRVPGGRPTVTGVDLELSFAYAGPIVVIAVTRGRPIGIDVEPLSGRVDDSLARHALAAPELEAFERLHPSLRRDALLRAWVRKEAVLKAAGVGLQIEPTRVETGVGRLTGEPVVVPGAGSFRLVDLGIEGFAGALAAGGTAPVRIRWPCAPPVTADTAPLADAVRGSRGRSSRRPLLSA